MKIPSLYIYFKGGQYSGIVTKYQGYYSTVPAGSRYTYKGANVTNNHPHLKGPEWSKTQFTLSDKP